MAHERLEIYVRYEVVDGELRGNDGNKITTRDIEHWREEGIHNHEMIDLLDAGTANIVEMKCGETQPSLWLAANDPRLPTEDEFYANPEIVFSIF